MAGKNDFIFTSRQRNEERSDTTRFSDNQGGDIIKDFEDHRRPLMKCALRSKLADLKKKGRTELEGFAKHGRSTQVAQLQGVGSRA